MSKIILLNKPFDVLSQFTDSDHRATLADYIPLKNVYPAGRLDRDSEGLLLLTDDGTAQHRIADPQHKMAKTYWAQVDGVPTLESLALLSKGVELKDGITLPASARIIEPPDIWPRTPPIRVRANIPTTWIELILKEGRNRQVRRMTAAVGHPTLRLIRYAIGPWNIDGLAPGEWKEVQCPEELKQATPTKKKTNPWRKRPPSNAGHNQNGLDTPRHRRSSHRKKR